MADQSVKDVKVVCEAAKHDVIMEKIRIINFVEIRDKFPLQTSLVHFGSTCASALSPNRVRGYAIFLQHAT